MNDTADSHVSEGKKTWEAPSIERIPIAETASGTFGVPEGDFPLAGSPS